MATRQASAVGPSEQDIQANAAALLEQATYDVGRGDTRSALVATLWSRRRLLGEAAAGAGHRSFAHVVDGAPL